MPRSKAYFINGGAGRVLSSIPAFEKLAETDNDFLVICEGGSDLLRGHPILDKRSFDHWHKGLFNDHLKNRDLYTPEPYRVWEYFNQKCSISQAFDIAINNQGVRELPPPSLHLSKMEISEAYKIVQEIKAKSGFDKMLVIQPFGRGVQNNGGLIVDPGSRSLAQQDLIDIINALKKEYAIIIMTEFGIPLGEDDSVKFKIPQPRIPNLRIWAAVIELADHFLGCDSVGQHIAKSLEKTATVITGSTFPINISYPTDPNFDIIDVGFGLRTYSPIRISMDDSVERSNEKCMELTDEHRSQILKSVRKRLGKSVKSKLQIMNIDPSKTAEAEKKSQIEKPDFPMSAVAKILSDNKSTDDLSGQPTNIFGTN
jgi:hypothetical protein